jgi:serine/threonine protein phosphatase 1
MKFNNKINKGDVIAVGDIHATWELYSQFLEWVKDSEASVILLGDLIDRGGDDLIVLEKTASLLEDPESWGLQSFSVVRGNHEQMFIDAVKDDRNMNIWLYNGGNLFDYEDIAEKHYGWISKLPYFITIADTLFVHAGVQPGKSPRMTLADDKGDQLVWIREPFLKKGPMLDKWNRIIKKVVHGHSITFLCEDGDENDPLPIVKKDRINLDTGAFLSNGKLTAYNATQKTFKQFARAE